MKRILYMATTVNGMIANEDDSTSWISEAEWNSYSRIVRSAGCMIIGHRTYDILTTQPEFAEFKDVKIVVVAKSDVKLLSTNHSVAHSPSEALDIFSGQPEVIIAGGGILNSAFLNEDLIDEIYIDIEPTLIGKGIPLVNGPDFNKNLKLLTINKISDDEVQLHYQVIR